MNIAPGQNYAGWSYKTDGIQHTRRSLLFLCAKRLGCSQYSDTTALMWQWNTLEMVPGLTDSYIPSDLRAYGQTCLSDNRREMETYRL